MTTKAKSFTERWLRKHGGKVRLRRDPRDARLQHLVKKHVNNNPS